MHVFTNVKINLKSPFHINRAVQPVLDSKSLTVKFTFTCII